MLQWNAHLQQSALHNQRQHKITIHLIKGPRSFVSAIFKYSRFHILTVDIPPWKHLAICVNVLNVLLVKWLNPQPWTSRKAQQNKETLFRNSVSGSREATSGEGFMGTFSAGLCVFHGSHLSVGTLYQQKAVRSLFLDRRLICLGSFGTSGMSLQAPGDVMSSVKQHGFWQQAEPTSDCFVGAMRLVSGTCPRVCHTAKQWGEIMYWFGKESAGRNRMNTVEMWGGVRGSICNWWLWLWTINCRGCLKMSVPEGCKEPVCQIWLSVRIPELGPL